MHSKTEMLINTTTYHNLMRYTQLPNSLKREIEKIKQNIIEDPSWDITRFSIQELKITPYSYKHILNKELK